jgi:hypothetical protein
MRGELVSLADVLVEIRPGENDEDITHFLRSRSSRSRSS